jgi:hypothetical protein
MLSWNIDPAVDRCSGYENIGHATPRLDPTKMADSTLVWGLLSSIIILFGCVRLLRSNRRPLNFPPSPPTLPLLGNLLQIPKTKGYLKIAELYRKYGSHGLLGLQLGPSTHVVVINNWRTARDLLEQRGAIYSSRPFVSGVEEVMPPPGNVYHLALMQYGSKWRKERKTFVEFMKRSEMEKRSPIMEAESSQFGEWDQESLFFCYGQPWEQLACLGWVPVVGALHTPRSLWDSA